jgi:D-glycero-D-manno-heptose 1,7-bisphosphate phosphatase
MSRSRPAVFLDRDGVLNVNLDAHVRRWEEFAFLSGAIDAVRRLHEAGWPIVVVTNQSAIGRGYTTADEVADIHERMCAAIASGGGRIARVMHCPHRPDDGCACRKPRPGMLLCAAGDLDLDLSRSYFVGDHLTDVEAATAAGCRPILVRSGRGAATVDDARARFAGLRVVDDLVAAADLILGEEVGGATGAEPSRCDSSARRARAP